MTLSKTIWITGASSGIGEALAIQWSLPGNVLILSGRNEEQLHRVAGMCRKTGGEIHVVAFDLTKEQDIAKAALKVKSLVSRIDILVNNGGIGQRSLIIDTTDLVANTIMNTDFWGHVNLTRRVLPFMIETGGGCIVVMSSLSGLFGFPQRSMYCAAKHALHGYFETLMLEHHKDNIHVTMVCPGRVKTNISYHALTATGNEHGKMDIGQKNGVTPAYCAIKIDKAVAKHKKQVIIGKKEVLMPYLKRYMPWLFYRIAMRLDPNA